jgi:hypothetical protein
MLPWQPLDSIEMALFPDQSALRYRFHNVNFSRTNSSALRKQGFSCSLFHLAESHRQLQFPSCQDYK